MSNPELVKAAPELVQGVIDRQAKMAKYIWIGIACVVAIILAIIYGPKLWKWATRSAEVANMAVMAAQVNKGNLSYPLNQFNVYADQLFQAMDGNGTDEEAIYAIFRAMNNADDLSQLIVTYGTREITDPLPWNPNKNMTLAAALRDELDSEELKTVNMIIAGKAIKYSF